MLWRPSRSITGMRSGIAAEIEADGRPHRLRLAARPHVQLDDQIRALLERPRQALARRQRNLPRCPAKKVALRKGRRVRNQPVVARLGIVCIVAPGRLGAIESKIGVVNDTRIAWPGLDTAHQPRAACRKRDDENPEHIDAHRLAACRARQATRSGPACQAASLQRDAASAADVYGRPRAHLLLPNARSDRSLPRTADAVQRKDRTIETPSTEA